MKDSDNKDSKNSRPKYSKPVLIDFSEMTETAIGPCHNGSFPSGGVCRTGAGATGKNCNVGTQVS